MVCRYVNARNTFAELLAYGTIPIVNENDTVASQRLRFGDNDTLSAQVRACFVCKWCCCIQAATSFSSAPFAALDAY
jgi:glutamate 5-kinase